MQFHNHFPIYMQIIDLIKRDIILDIRRPGDKLSSVRDYAVELKVNPNTVQKAYQEMERDGLVFSQRGIGRFIVENGDLKTQLMKEVSTTIVAEFIEKMQAIGCSHKEILERLEHGLNGG